MIPKRINYVWLGGQPLPDQIKKNILTWQEKNPEYEIIEFNEKIMILIDISLLPMHINQKNGLLLVTWFD